MNASSRNESDDFAELVEMYVAEMPARIAALSAAVASNDRDQVRRLLHQLVGSAGSYGFNSLSVEARKVEMALHGGVSLPDVSSGICDVIEMCERVQIA
jgi:HPt (histidine-containing phosphotransfer) domain-containing protein